MKPVIGIALDLVRDVKMYASRGVPDQMIVETTKPIYDAVWAAGGVPVGLGEAPALEDALELCQAIDGLIVPGGPDIFPGTYGKPVSRYNSMLCIEKDESDVRYIRAMVQLGKPMLGICRGMQLMNGLAGGEMVEDIPAFTDSKIVHFSPVVPAWLATHQVRVDPDSGLGKVFPQGSFGVNSFHHQCVKTPGKGMRIIAWGEDGLAEATEGEAPYCLGVQWHPEYLYEKDPQQLEILRYFIGKCR
ncbi:MAG TPA: gamma-glutamyl-gamma-aminobutyrate hydrolase family protein [Firmicutes bacterium]|nr:gamma-glutamyl-gamma-aminobutyrate hydrolase family protein [Bacillota bacterium]